MMVPLIASAHEHGAFEEEAGLRVRAAWLILRLRGLGVVDRAVLNAIETVPRTLFVPPEWRDHAYLDRPLPIACGQTISAPSLIARMTAALEVSDRHSVLEIGTGSGYQTAVLAKLARRITTIDRFRTLVRDAEQRWRELGIRNVSAVVADGALGWKPQAPFDRIMLTAAAPSPPVQLIKQLTDSGVLIAPVGLGDAAQRLTIFQRIGQKVDTHDLGPVNFLPMMAGVAQNL